MKYGASDCQSSCVAILIHRPLSEPDDAAQMVRSALELWGLDIWPKIELECFPSNGDTLILARPASGIRVSVADYALPFISGDR